MTEKDDRPAGEKGFVSLRDHFAAAAVTGLLSNIPRYQLGVIAVQAYDIADEMLRERVKHPVGVAEMDSAADRKSVAAHGACARSCSQPFDSAPTTQPAPPRVETDGFSPGSRSGQINRSPERQSPDRECGESSLRDVPQLDNSRAAGGPEHHISDAQIDALECVVEDGRIVGMSVYGHLRSLLVMLRPEWEDPNDPAEATTTQPRKGAPSGVTDPDSRVWGTPCKPHPQATPAEGSVPGEGSVPDSRNWKEPVAWAVEKKGYPPMFAVFNDWNFACRAAMEEYAEIVPLYRHPPCQDLLQKNFTLTADEREAMRFCSVVLDMGERPDCAATLRKLLERTK